MVEVYKNLFVGNLIDYESNPSYFKEWFVVHACKDPFHRRALGYTGRGAPKDSPYYYSLYDNNGHLILNIVDAESSRFFSDIMMNEAIDYCIKGLELGKKVFVHCNQGESRAPSIALLVLRKIGFYNCSFDNAVIDFRNRYPLYNPSKGIYEYLMMRW